MRTFMYSITNWSKRSTIVIMLVMTMTLGAKAVINNTQNYTTSPVEPVSNETVEAMKANVTLPQTNQEIPVNHNYALDKTLRMFVENEDDENYINDILNNMYKYNGTFLGSAFAQHEIDFQMLYAFITKRHDLLIKNSINSELGKTIQEFGPKFYNTVEPNQDIINNWLEKKYNILLANDLQFDHMPSAKEVCERLDSIADKKAGFTQLEKAVYFMQSDAYIRNYIKTKDVQSMSDLIAYKMYLIDKTVMEKTMSGFGVFGMGSFENGNLTIKDYYKMWMDSVDPSKEKETQNK